VCFAAEPNLSHLTCARLGLVVLLLSEGHDWPVCPQANLGAKNHAVIMPDAAPESTANALVGAAFGTMAQTPLG